MLATRLSLAFAALLLLPGCLLTPGKFTSTLDIRADRSFAFAYRGEVIAQDMDGMMQPADPAAGDKGEQPSGTSPTAFFQEDGPAAGTPAKPDTAESRAKMDALAAALTREKGFRSVRYLGEGKFDIDYAISGSLTHAFLFPFNTDAEVLVPFIAVELRGDDRVRVKAPGFANGQDKVRSPMGGGNGSDAAKYIDGTFTLTTNAEIVSQNQEDGPGTVAGGRQLSWKVTPLTGEAPMAVLRFPGR